VQADTGGIIDRGALEEDPVTTVTQHRTAPLADRVRAAFQRLRLKHPPGGRTDRRDALPAARGPSPAAAARSHGLRLVIAQSGCPVRLARGATDAAVRAVSEGIAQVAEQADAAVPLRLELRWSPRGLDLRLVNTPGETGFQQLLALGRGVQDVETRLLGEGCGARAGMSPDGFAIEAHFPAFSPAG
jgi:hypothetical protein